MHILWVKTELLHPIDKGGRIRSYNMLRALRKRHQITYVALTTADVDNEAVARSTEYCHQLIQVPFREAPRRSVRFWLELLHNLATPLPYAIAKYRSRAMRDVVEHLARDPSVDLLVCDFLAPSQNIPDGLPVRTVLFQHNVEAAIWARHAAVRSNILARAYFRSQWRRMVAFEGRECRRFDRVVAVSLADAETFTRDYGAAAVSSVPTGVDTDYFRPTGLVTREPAELVFTGSMDWLPNEDGINWFVGTVLPLVHRHRPDVSLTIVGRNPPAAIRALAGRDAHIRVTGTVPDVRPYLERAAISIVPLRIGGGTRLKIFEAMAMERPVVSTTIGAEGLAVESGRHLLLADDAAAFADALLKLLSDPAHAREVANLGANLVRTQYAWSRAVEDFVRHLDLGDRTRHG